MCILLAIGILDDLMDISAKIKLFLHAIVVTIFIQNLVQITSLGGIFGNFDFELLSFAPVFTIIAIIGTINAVNMSDGIDGLAAANSVFVFFLIAVISYIGDNALVFSIAILFTSSLVIFLFFNLDFFGPDYKIFLGDSGTALLGFVICTLVIMISQGPDKIVSPITSLWLMALPIIDTLAIIGRRIKKGLSPFSADRDHLHHIFLRAGLNNNKALTIILFISISLSSFGLFLEFHGVPEWISFMLFLLTLFVYVFLLSHSWKLIRKIKD